MKDNTIVLNSNRDENINRVAAEPPQAFTDDKQTLFYPLDTFAGGTWFCVKESGDAIVLLNGGEKKHTPQPPYRRSRGLIVLDLMRELRIVEAWKNLDMVNIEPFTLVVTENKKLFQLRWTGEEKSTLQLDEKQPHIWSSSTLYTDEIKAVREKWFEGMLAKKNHQPTPDDFWHFHTTPTPGDAENGIIINRNNTMLTRSITQCVISDTEISFRYFDTITKNTTQNVFRKNKTCLA